MKLTDEEVVLLLNLVKAAEYMALVTQPDNELREKLRKVYDKLNA